MEQQLSNILCRVFENKDALQSAEIAVNNGCRENKEMKAGLLKSEGYTRQGNFQVALINNKIVGYHWRKEILKDKTDMEMFVDNHLDTSLQNEIANRLSLAVLKNIEKTKGHALKTIKFNWK